MILIDSNVTTYICCQNDTIDESEIRHNSRHGEYPPVLYQGCKEISGYWSWCIEYPPAISFCHSLLGFPVFTWMFPNMRGTPKSSILIGMSIINHPFWGTTIVGNPHILFGIASINRISWCKWCCQSRSQLVNVVNGCRRSIPKIWQQQKNCGVFHNVLI